MSLLLLLFFLVFNAVQKKTFFSHTLYLACTAGRFIVPLIDSLV